MTTSWNYVCKPKTHFSIITEKVGWWKANLSHIKFAARFTCIGYILFFSKVKARITSVLGSARTCRFYGTQRTTRRHCMYSRYRGRWYLKIKLRQTCFKECNICSWDWVIPQFQRHGSIWKAPPPRHGFPIMVFSNVSFGEFLQLQKTWA